MDWKTLYLEPNGRIGQSDFWIGTAIMIAVSVVLGWIPVIGQIIQLALIYAGICVMSKRLHDFGKSGWLAAVPYGLLAIAIVVSLLAGFGMLAAAGAANYGDSAAGVGAIMAAGTIGLVWIIAGLACLAFWLWVGLTKGDPGENQYGPPPRKLIGGDAPSTPAA
jgi:uncharacterized membrane protein YhaH (DUF805 family)